AYKDFVEKAEDFGISDVNKSLFDEGVQQKSTMAELHTSDSELDLNRDKH
ncbi:unnamed protein product, partial [marine sediment metagenome]